MRCHGTGQITRPGPRWGSPGMCCRHPPTPSMVAMQAPMSPTSWSTGVMSRTSPALGWQDIGEDATRLPSGGGDRGPRSRQRAPDPQCPGAGGGWCSPADAGPGAGRGWAPRPTPAHSGRCWREGSCLDHGHAAERAAIHGPEAPEGVRPSLVVQHPQRRHQALIRVRDRHPPGRRPSRGFGPPLRTRARPDAHTWHHTNSHIWHHDTERMGVDIHPRSLDTLHETPLIYPLSPRRKHRCSRHQNSH